ncbi:hypothetical protein MCHI_003633 [Candidatus Magnetoovum chiemensis]|nr:hypothetical protein MCHI_003633 [Candidatus Magnetoovum chiemensis]
MPVDKPDLSKEEAPAFKALHTVNLYPGYHTPLDRWRRIHMDKLKSKQVTIDNCVVCHTEPNKFCNRCHDYLGTKRIHVDKSYKEILQLETPKMEAPDTHTPADEWRFKHDNYIIFEDGADISTCLGCHSSADKFCNKCHTKGDIRPIITK